MTKGKRERGDGAIFNLVENTKIKHETHIHKFN